MTRLVCVLSALVLLANPLTAWSRGILQRNRRAVSYYYAVPTLTLPLAAYNPPIVVVPAAPIVCPPTPALLTPPRLVPIPQPATTGRNYAQPTAAPPSPGGASIEPPLAVPRQPAKPGTSPPDQGPTVSEPRYYYDSYTVAPRGNARPATDRGSVIFWNLTSQDLTLLMDGRAHVIPMRKSLALEVGRQFVWRLEGRDPQTERIAAGETGIEIVIRR